MNYSTISAASVLLAIGLCACSTPHRTNYQRHLEKAECFYKAGKFNDALREVRLAQTAASIELEIAQKKVLHAGLEGRRERVGEGQSRRGSALESRILQE